MSCIGLFEKYHKEIKVIHDSGCSRHMIGDPSEFVKFKPNSSEKVTFRDDMKVKTIGIGDVGKNGKTFIHNVFLVDNLDYNLLRISQLCDKNLYVLFKKYECLVLEPRFKIIFF